MHNYRKIIIVTIVGFLFSGCSTTIDRAFNNGQLLNSQLSNQGYDNCLTLNNSEKYCRNKWYR